MDEVEFKFGIPPARLAGLAAELRRGRCHVERLQAAYFDTADGRLARAGIAVRLRREGERWLQTAKAPTGRAMARLEDNAPVPPPAPGSVPLLDLGRHHGTEVGAAIEKALGGGPAAAVLQLVFQTDVARTTRVVRIGGARIELALDLGTVEARGRFESIRELELELKKGDFAALLALATRWSQGHGLWLATRSKAERGARLGEGEREPGAVKAQAPDVEKKVGPRGLLADTIEACLAQILGNAGTLAEGCESEEVVHQLRVGLRRLRTALRELGATAAGADPGWEGVLRSVFHELGDYRDRAVVMPALIGRLERAGAPSIPASALPQRGRLPTTVVREPVFQRVLLELIGFARSASAGDDGAGPSARTQLASALEALHHQVTKDAKRFESLPTARQHRVRKRLKRLRYLSEFAAPLFGEKAVERYLAQWRRAQDALGEFNDERVATNLFRAAAERQPQAWFAVGWLEAKKPRAAKRCRRALREAQQATPFWRGH